MLKNEFKKLKSSTWGTYYKTLSSPCGDLTVSILLCDDGQTPYGEIFAQIGKEFIDGSEWLKKAFSKGTEERKELIKIVRKELDVSKESAKIMVKLLRKDMIKIGLL